MTTLITGAGLVGTSFAQCAVRRGEDVVFVDPQPREDYVRAKLGSADFKIIADDVTLTTADGKLHWFIPSELNGYDLVGISMASSTPSSSSLPPFQSRNVVAAAFVLSTALTLD